MIKCSPFTDYDFVFRREWNSEAVVHLLITTLFSGNGILKLDRRSTTQLKQVKTWYLIFHCTVHCYITIILIKDIPASYLQLLICPCVEMISLFGWGQQFILTINCFM